MTEIVDSGDILADPPEEKPHRCLQESVMGYCDYPEECAAEKRGAAFDEKANRKRGE